MHLVQLPSLWKLQSGSNVRMAFTPRSSPCMHIRTRTDIFHSVSVSGKTWNKIAPKLEALVTKIRSNLHSGQRVRFWVSRLISWGCDLHISHAECAGWKAGKHGLGIRSMVPPLEHLTVCLVYIIFTGEAAGQACFTGLSKVHDVLEYLHWLAHAKYIKWSFKLHRGTWKKHAVPSSV